jgi:NADPH2:quinone reductase
MANRAIVLEKLGGPEVLRVREMPVADPGPGEVRVRAAGIAFAQVMMRHGTYPYQPPLPFVPGAEIAGIVEEIGAGAVGFQPGEHVVAFTFTGGYADRICVPAERLVAAPAGLDFASLASLPTNYVTALQMLEREAHARAGESVVIHGAGGGVGTALLQLARVLGLRAIGTERAAKLELVRELGAAVIDYQREDVAARVRELCPAGADIVLDPIGGEHAPRSYAMLHAGGRLVVYGFAGGDSPEAIAALRARLQAWNALPGGARTSLYSLGARHRSEPELIVNDLRRLVGWLAEGRIAPVIAARVPLEEVAAAHHRLEFEGVQGKLVLVT